MWPVCICVCVLYLCTAACVRVCRLDPSSSLLRRPLCRFKSCPSEAANSSCSIFIKPLSLKEPYPDHGKSHSSRPRSHALSILALIPPLPARLSPLSLSLSHPLYLSRPSIPPPLPPSLSLSLWPTHTHTHTYLHTLRHFLSHSYIHKHTHTHTIHMLMHTLPLNPSESNIPVQAGGSGAAGDCLAALSLSLLCCHSGKKRVSTVLSFLFLSFLEC